MIGLILILRVIGAAIKMAADMNRPGRGGRRRR